MDPRVTATPADLKSQFDLSVRLAGAMGKDAAALADVKATRVRLAERKARARGDALVKALASLDEQLAPLEGTGGGRRGRRGGSTDDLARLNGQLAALLGAVQGADAAPTSQAVTAAADLEGRLGRLLATWKELLGGEIPAANRLLDAEKLPPLSNTPVP
jgi:hypothetical protein